MEAVHSGQAQLDERVFHVEAAFDASKTAER